MPQVSGFGFGLSAVREVLAQGKQAKQEKQGAAPIPSRRVKTTKLFRSPEGFPSAIAVTPQGRWIGEQELSGCNAVNYKVPEPFDLTERAWLVDNRGDLIVGLEHQ